MSDFKKLKVWQKAHLMMPGAHRVSGRMRGPNSSLRNQLVRAAMSVAANIVEGKSSPSQREFARFLRIALSSTSEVEYHLIAGRDIGAISETDYTTLLSQVIEVRKMLHGLIRKLSPEKTVEADPRPTLAPERRASDARS